MENEKRKIFPEAVVAVKVLYDDDYELYTMSSYAKAAVCYMVDFHTKFNMNTTVWEQS